jgi:16S rRNA (uracil1498-N3)-methyltransferase
VADARPERSPADTTPPRAAAGDESADSIDTIVVNARFHAPEAHAPGDLVPLPEDEAEHLTRVLRLKPGAVVRVFNGRGLEFEAVVESAAKAVATVRLTERREPAPEPRIAVTLVQAVLKGDKMDDVVRDAVMLGVAAIQPVVTARSETSIAAMTRSGRRHRWERIAVSSAKQCGRAAVPPVADAIGFADVTHRITSLEIPGPALMLVEPGASGDAAPLSDLDVPPPRQAAIIVGPEGGWTSDEVERAAATCRLVSLGGRTLRADAMALIALSAVFTMWKEF